MTLNELENSPGLVRGSRGNDDVEGTARDRRKIMADDAIKERGLAAAGQENQSKWEVKWSQ